MARLRWLLGVLAVVAIGTGVWYWHVHLRRDLPSEPGTLHQFSPGQQRVAPEVLLPPSYGVRRAYPLVVFLPPLGGTAQDVVDGFLQDVRDVWGSRQARFEEWLRRFPARSHASREQAFVLALMAGRGSLDGGFDSAIHQAEAGVAEAIVQIGHQYRIDRRRIFLAGFSLGGDVGFALTVRHPDRFAGAVIMSSAMNYRVDKYLKTLPGHRIHMYMTMGALDPRLGGMRQSQKMLEHYGVRAVLKLSPGQKHEPPPGVEFLNAVQFLLSSNGSNESIGS